MSKFHSGSNQDVQEVVPVPPPNTTNLDGGIFGLPAYWNGNIYVTGVAYPLQQFLISNGNSGVSPKSILDLDLGRETICFPLEMRELLQRISHGRSRRCFHSSTPANRKYPRPGWSYWGAGPEPPLGRLGYFRSGICSCSF